MINHQHGAARLHSHYEDFVRSRTAEIQPNSASPVEHFRHAMSECGLVLPETVHADGSIHRFSSNGRSGDRAGWYVLFTDGLVAGAFGCWRLGVSRSWHGENIQELTAAERQALNARIRHLNEMRDAERAEAQALAMQVASTRWDSASAVDTHPYLDRKGVQAFGIRQQGDKLLLPLRDESGALCSLQTIDPSGDKRFLAGGRISGCYLAIGELSDTVIICEGYATGASLYESTGLAVAVSFNAGNLQKVAVAFRGKFPKLKIIVGADNDQDTPGNPGLTKARAAASSVNGLLAIPQGDPQGLDKVCDFNDLYQAEGAEVVQKCIQAARPCAEPLKVPSARAGRSVQLLNGADLKPEAVRWLWPQWLALGKFHILAGAPGQGKTTIAMAMAAIITSGGHWPDGSRCPRGNVLIWSGEDDPADTLMPRLVAAGADPSRCFFVGGTQEDGRVHAFDPAHHMQALEDKIRETGGVKLLVVDPVVSAVAGDGHKNNDVRRALQPVVDLASRLDAAVIGITHFSKGGAGADPTSRVIGSIAFAAVARVVLVAGKGINGHGERCRVLARAKSNIGPDEGGFEYSIEQSEPIPGIQASYVSWGDQLTGTARELLDDSTEEKGDAADAKTAKGQAEAFLVDLLRDGPCPTKRLEMEAKAAGIAWRTVRRASETLAVKKKKHDGIWYWTMPPLTGQRGQVGQASNRGQVGQVEPTGLAPDTPHGVAGVDVEVF